MAHSNEGVGFVEQHIEKIVLAVCALWLGYAALHWMPSSPREVKALNNAGTTIAPTTPGQADEDIARGAKAIRERLDKATVNTPKVAPWGAMLKEVADNPFPAPTPPGVAAVELASLSPQVAVLNPIDANGLPSLGDVVDLIPIPPKPNCQAAFELPEGDQAKDVRACHGAAFYPWDRLRKDWEARLSRLPAVNIVVLGVEVEVQEKPEGGDWMAPRPAALVRQPVLDAQGKLVVQPKIPRYDGNNTTEVQNALTEIARNWQSYILNPDEPNIFDSITGRYVPWPVHLPPEIKEGLKTVIMTVPATGTTPETQTPYLRPPTGTVPLPRPTGPGPGPTGVPPMPPPSIYGPEGPGGIRPPYIVTPHLHPTAPPTTPTPTTHPGVPAGPSEILIPTIPPLAGQIAAGQVLVAFHDWSLALGTSYRYRYRLMLLNPLLTFDQSVRDPNDARATEVLSLWSDWSNEVSLESPTRFFVTGGIPGSNKVRVTVFTRKLGQTLQRTFMVESGMAIGHVEKIKLPRGGDAAIDVDFSTGALAVDADFERPAVRGQFGGARALTTTTALLYLDKKGELKTRLQQEDENSAEYKRLLSEAPSPH